MLSLETRHMSKDITDRQLDLMYGHSENSLKRHLEERLGRPLVLVLTENASTMLSVKLHDGVPRIRLHRMFLNAGNEVLDEIASYIKKRKASMPLFRSFVRENREGLVIKPPKKVPIKTAGTCHDLRELHDAVNREYFNGTIDAVITWGSRSPRSSVRRRTLGSYSERSHIIRINPVLDRKAVPHTLSPSSCTMKCSMRSWARSLREREGACTRGNLESKKSFFTSTKGLWRGSAGQRYPADSVELREVLCYSDDTMKRLQDMLQSMICHINAGENQRNARTLRDVPGPFFIRQARQFGRPGALRCHARQERRTA